MPHNRLISPSPLDKKKVAKLKTIKKRDSYLIITKESSFSKIFYFVHAYIFVPLLYGQFVKEKKNIVIFLEHSKRKLCHPIKPFGDN